MEHALAIVGAVSNIITTGNALINCALTLCNAQQELEDRIASIRSHWIRIEAQLQFVQRAWEGLCEEHRVIQFDNLKRLHRKVKSADKRVQQLIIKRKRATDIPNEQYRVRRLRYLFVKPYLDAIIRDLADWQALNDPSWFLIMKISSSVIDDSLNTTLTASSSREATRILRSASKVRRAALNAVEDSDTHVLLPSEGLKGIQIWPIPHSSAMVARRPDSSTFIIDSIPCPRDSYAGVMYQDIRSLAVKLRAADPDIFGVLSCQGVVKTKAQNSGRVTSFEIAFSIPPGQQPYTLRTCLIERRPHSLTERLKVAKRLATAVSFMHTLSFVHKNVRPENFIGLTSDGQIGLGTFGLIGFEHVRVDNGMTYMRGSEDWATNIYRHPERQGAMPEERYNMRHDIYSLGVCLLEIGLWRSFVSYGDDGTIRAPGEGLGITLDELQRRSARAIKNYLVSLAGDQLPAIVGDLYTEVVMSCLTCLDEESQEFGETDELEDADGVLMGVNFIEKILSKLNAISI